MYFPPKKDLWLGIVLWGIILFSIWGVIQERATWPAVVFVILEVAFIGSLWFGTGYTITDKSLEIRYGPFHEKIPFREIRRVKRTRAPWSSAALSLDRLEIKYSSSITLISPLNSLLFINELKQRCPEAEFPGL